MLALCQLVRTIESMLERESIESTSSRHMLGVCTVDMSTVIVSFSGNRLTGSKVRLIKLEEI